MTDLLTPTSVRADIAALLHLSPDEVPDDQDLFESGLDSVRLITLVERWRDAGADVSFVELAEQPILTHWLTLVPTRSSDSDV
jgi:bifunctional isochorismate lyase/aryl carrier protein